jgi:hypothetical protein
VLSSLLLPLVACGRAGLYAPDVASTGAGAAAGDAVAFCASPAACNDLPTMSALAGTCHVSPPPPALPNDPPSWYCDCAEGFSLNPSTQLCRAGTACQAAAADPWTVTVDLPTSDCAARLAEDCGRPGVPQVERLNSHVLLFLDQMCRLPPYYTVRLELVNGCASRYQIKFPGGGPVSPDLVSCLKVLLKFRFTCALPTDCAMVEWDTIVP